MEQEKQELEVLDEGREDCEEISGCCTGPSAKK
jgi:putative radical SAM-modified peptide